MGWNAWTDNLDMHGWTRKRLVAEIIKSVEFRQKGTNAQYVTGLYRFLLNREPDTKGFNTHVNNLNSGATNRLALFEGFLSTPEYAGTGPYTPK